MNGLGISIWEEGHTEGLAEGHKVGLAEGHKAGLAESSEHSAIRMIDDGNLPVEKISLYSGLSLEYVIELKRKRQTPKQNKE